MSYALSSPLPMNLSLRGLSKSQINARAREEPARIFRENRIQDYRPYPKQREFHAAGLKHRERLFRAGNLLGKSYSGGAVAAYHLTGLPIGGRADGLNRLCRLGCGAGCDACWETMRCEPAVEAVI